MLHAASLTRQLLERGSDALSAITTSLKQVYLRNQVSEQSKQVSSFCMKHETSMWTVVFNNIMGLSGILEEFILRKLGKTVEAPVNTALIQDAPVIMHQ